MAANRHVELRQRIDDQVRRAIAHGQFERAARCRNPLTRRKPGLMTVDFELDPETFVGKIERFLPERLARRHAMREPQ
jgi:hypothetical protein